MSRCIDDVRFRHLQIFQTGGIAGEKLSPGEDAFNPAGSYAGS